MGRKRRFKVSLENCVYRITRQHVIHLCGAGVVFSLTLIVMAPSDVRTIHSLNILSANSACCDIRSAATGSHNWLFYHLETTNPRSAYEKHVCGGVGRQKHYEINVFRSCESSGQSRHFPQHALYRHSFRKLVCGFLLCCLQVYPCCGCRYESALSPTPQVSWTLRKCDISSIRLILTNNGPNWKITAMNNDLKKIQQAVQIDILTNSDVKTWQQAKNHREKSVVLSYLGVLTAEKPPQTS